MSRLFDDLQTTRKLQTAVSAVVTGIRNTWLVDLWYVLDLEEYRITRHVQEYPLTIRSCVCWMNELAKIDSCLSVYFTAVAFLHVAYKSSRRGLNDELMDVLATLFGQVVRKRHYSNDSVSLLSLGQAAKLMKVVANKSLSTMSHIAIELSNAYLYRA